MTKRVLFVLKLRHTSAGTGQTILKSSGLSNSAQYVADMLQSNGVETKVVQVVDNNAINREVTLFKPDVVIIEALWVVPDKFEILQKIHPDIKWIIRIHSEIPFLANEGIAIKWLNEYLRFKNVFISFNSLKTYNDVLTYYKACDDYYFYQKSKVIYLPNYYPVSDKIRGYHIYNKKNLDVGCFGAIRPMKNQLVQAYAAIKFARKHGYHLRFHINANRTDNESGKTVLKNLRYLFDGLPRAHYKLVEHDWMDRENFLEVVRRMDIGMQVSLSETFNIVTADFVSEGIPIVVSPEVEWMPWLFKTDATDADKIVFAMERAIFYDKYLSWLNLPKKNLIKYVTISERVWLDNLDRLD